jgi:hypothetical protein
MEKEKKEEKKEKKRIRIRRIFDLTLRSVI